MPRLFTALHPPSTELDRIAARVTAITPIAEALVPDLRWTPRVNWHVTLCFHGEDDVESRWATLRPRLTDLPAPRLRLAGGGTFGGVLWVGVAPAGPADATGLADLAEAAGADPAEYTAHLTVARWRARPGARIDARGLAGLFADYTGGWFTPSEVVLMRSEPGPRGPKYHVEQRLALSGS
ncbi:MAG TPA: 2'-5' RNA ligase family protein [Pseudonocardiaceae bacterium]